MPNNMMQQVNVQTGQLYTLQLSSKLESITALETLIEEIADKYNVSEDTFGNMMTCLNEVVNNAIIHGNKLDPDKKVIVNLEIDTRRAIWTVTDEGPGFDYVHLADPTAPENLENLSGRGVYIIKMLADQCVFNTAGNEVELLFKL
jgi:serine/threonine-protein kinase RsbW